MNWIPIEIKTEWLSIETIKDFICDYMDANDYAEESLNVIYGNCRIRDFLIPTGTVLRKIFEKGDGDEWENIINDILEYDANKIKFELENKGECYFLSYHIILVD